jgi:hypothetical protein
VTRDELKARLFLAVAAVATTGAAIYALAAPFETPH